MMIPDKIYVDSDELLRGAAYVEVSPSESNVIENPVIYILAPIAKRFDVEKPKEDGWYLARHSVGPFLPKFYMCDLDIWCRENDPAKQLKIQINEWCEIILPTIPEEV